MEYGKLNMKTNHNNDVLSSRLFKIDDNKTQINNSIEKISNLLDTILNLSSDLGSEVRFQNNKLYQ